MLEGFEVTVILIQREFKDVLELITAALVEITRNQFELLSADVDDETTAAVTVFNKRYSDQVHSFGDEDRSIETTLGIGWDLLSMLPDEELKRIKLEYIQKYHPVYKGR